MTTWSILLHELSFWSPFCWRNRNADEKRVGVGHLRTPSSAGWAGVAGTVVTFTVCCCSFTKSCLTLWDPMDCSMSGFPVLHYLLEFVQTHVHWVRDAIQPSHPLSPPSSPALNLFQHQGLFQWTHSSHQVAKVLEFWLQHQSLQWIFRTDFLEDWLLWSPCCPEDSQESSPAPQFESINSEVFCRG